MVMPYTASRKTAIKTAKSPRSGSEIPLGAHPGNTGGKKGRSGRKPIAFVQECSRIADEQVLPKVEALLTASDPSTAEWRWAAEYISKYSKSPAPTCQTVEHEGETRHGVIIL